MKIIFLLLGILSSLCANILAEKTITCKRRSNNPTACEFYNVTLGKHEAVLIETDPEDLKVRTIESVRFSGSSIYSVPAEIFSKFPNVKKLWLDGQNVQDIEPGTFLNANNLKLIDLENNQLKVLHEDSFKGNYEFLYSMALVLSHSFFELGLKLCLGNQAI
jgi:hypothetical protein